MVSFQQILKVGKNIKIDICKRPINVELVKKSSNRPGHLIMPLQIHLLLCAAVKGYKIRISLKSLNKEVIQKFPNFRWRRTKFPLQLATLWKIKSVSNSNILRMNSHFDKKLFFQSCLPISLPWHFNVRSMQMDISKWKEVWKLELAVVSFSAKALKCHETWAWISKFHFP